MPLSFIHPAEGLCWVAVSTVHSPGNLGSMIRTGDAVGAAGVLFIGEGPDPYDPAAVRASMGALFAQRFVRTTLPEVAAWKERHGCLLVGTSPAAREDYHEIRYPPPAVLFMGGERKLCDRMVRIPMVGRSVPFHLRNLAIRPGIESEGMMRPSVHAWTLVPVLLLAAVMPAGAAQQEPMPSPQESKARSEATAVLVRLLKDPDATVRGTALMALSTTRPPEATPLLIAQLRNTDPQYLKETIDLLAQIQTREVVTALVRLADEKQGDTRLRIARALSSHPVAFPELRAFYERLTRMEDQRLRVTAAAAFGNMLLPPNYPRLQPYLPGEMQSANGFGGGNAGAGGGN